jgi:Calx-beta domain
MRRMRRLVVFGATLALGASMAGYSALGSPASAVAQPTIAITGVSQVEGGATSVFAFAVTVTDPAGGAAHGDGTVSFFTTDGSAHAPGDYTAVPQASPQQLAIVTGTDSYVVDVTVNGNAVPEVDETFTVTLTDPSTEFQIDPLHPSATGTILNDDGSGNYSVTNSLGAGAPVGEGNSGTTAVEFTVTRAQPSVQATVTFAVSAPDGATLGTDYTVATTSPVHFAAGATASEPIVVNVAGDTVAEPDETVVVTLGSATPPATSLVQPSDSVIIRNDDSAITGFKVANTSVQAVEGASSTTTSMVFTVTRTASTVTSSVDFTITDAGAGATHAACTADFFAAGLAGPDPDCETSPYHGTLTFVPGDTHEEISVNVVGDDLPEGDQMFNVDLTNFVNTDPGTPPTYALEAHGTIVNDDGVGIVTVGPAGSVAEGGSGSHNQLVFTVARTWGGGQVTPEVEQDATIGWHALGPAGGGSGVATWGVDFTETSGQVTIPAGGSAVQIKITIVGDSLREPAERVSIALEHPVGGSATLGDPSTAFGTITDDDVAVSYPTAYSLAIGGLRHVDSGYITFAIGLSSPPGQPVRIAYATRESTGFNAATADVQFRTVYGYVDFAPGDSQAKRTKPIKLLAQGPHKDQVFEFVARSLTPGILFKTADGGRSTIQASTVTIAGQFTGFRVVAADGATFDYDGASHLTGCNPHCGYIGAIVGMAPTPDGRGFWLATTSGRVYTSGSAHYYGGLSRKPAGGQIQAIAASPDGRGYWLLGDDGGVFTFGPGASFYGGLGGLRLSAPAIKIVPTPSGHGYWIVATDGGVFAFGDAQFFGAFAGRMLSPGDFVAAMARTSDGRGYWLVTGKGGVFAFGNARYLGNAINRFSPASGSVVAIAATSDDKGYIIVTSDNDPRNSQAFVFGNAHVGALGERATGIPASSFVIGASSI